ncbi:hypothetical protein GCM10007898_42010 [Dyella flagellata]|uniref:Isochorismatase-like domain-containing protein n=2 Tax=Dyella flagellata TaxID=1867833 RepID=A0ABQ5XG02_9GAMM|nr:hypothetical protein GCM10007898_42010 [Dyella flagellata]
MASVLLIIDMQVDFFAHEGLVRQRSALAAHTNALIAMARAAKVPIVWVKQEFLPDLSDASLEVKRGRISIVIAGTPGAMLLPELDAQVQDLVVVKKRYSAFFGTVLDTFLSRIGCTRLIVAGINTHACIRTTVVDAYQRDYEVILAGDCISSHDKTHHEISWKYMDGKLGIGMSNERLGDLLRSQVVGAEPLSRRSR